jgi:hypothetical protein
MDNIELSTDKGVATYCGDLGNYSVLIHASPEPDCERPNAYQGELDVILSVKGTPDKFLGSIPLNDVVASRGLDFEGGIELSDDDCLNIDDMCWQVLISKYGIAPTKLVAPES